MIVISTTVITLLLSAAFIDCVSLPTNDPTENSTVITSSSTPKVDRNSLKKASDKTKSIKDAASSIIPEPKSSNTSETPTTNVTNSAINATTVAPSQINSGNSNETHTTEKVPELIPPASVEPDIHYIRRSEIDV